MGRRGRPGQGEGPSLSDLPGHDLWSKLLLGLLWGLGRVRRSWWEAAQTSARCGRCRNPCDRWGRGCRASSPTRRRRPRSAPAPTPCRSVTRSDRSSSRSPMRCSAWTASTRARSAIGALPRPSFRRSRVPWAMGERAQRPAIRESRECLRIEARPSIIFCNCSIATRIKEC